MTARQPFRDRKLDDKRSIIAESKSRPLVIQLTRKFSVMPYFGADGRGGSESKHTRRDAEDPDLPSFPGESWFGG